MQTRSEAPPSTSGTLSARKGGIDWARLVRVVLEAVGVLPIPGPARVRGRSLGDLIQ